MKYESKKALISDIEREYSALSALLDSIPTKRYLEPGVWGDGWNVRDLVAHLYEWHQLFLGWFDDGKRGEIPTIPAAGFSYRETPRLNREIWRRYSGSEPAETRRWLNRSHEQVLALTRGLTGKQLLQPGYFAWTKRNALVTYLGANTSSHYRFAIKVLRRWLRDAVTASDRRGRSDTRMRLFTLIAVGVLACTSPLAGQSSRAASADLSVGLDTGRGSSYSYKDRPGFTAEITVVPKHAGNHLIAVTAGARGSPAANQMCLLEPDGSCSPDFPSIVHVAVLAGIERRNRAGEARAMAGPGFFAAKGGSGVGMRAQADLSLGGKQLAFILVTRGTWFLRFNGERVWLAGAGFGLRIGA